MTFVHLILFPSIPPPFFLSSPGMQDSQCGWGRTENDGKQMEVEGGNEKEKRNVGNIQFLPILFKGIA